MADQGEPAAAGGGDAAVAPSREASLRKWDLTEKLSACWDPQMLLQVLSWLQEKKRYPEAEISAALKKTLFAANVSPATWERMGVTRDPEYVGKWEVAEKRFLELEAKLQPVIKFFQQKRTDIRKEGAAYPERQSFKSWHQAYLNQRDKDDGRRDTEWDEGTMADFFEFSTLSYVQAPSTCYKFLTFIDFVGDLTGAGQEFEQKVSLTWGMLATMILMLPAVPTMAGGPARSTLTDEQGKEKEEAEWAGSLVMRLVKFDEMLEDWYPGEIQPITLPSDGTDGGAVMNRSNVAFTPVEALEHNKRKRGELVAHRTWLLHWAIWPLFKYHLRRQVGEGRTSFEKHGPWGELIDWMFRERNLGTVLVAAPHLLRYYAVIAILNRSREDHFHLACQAISEASQSGKYSDPFTSLLEALFVDFDFERAQKILAECALAAEADFFLEPLKAAVEENARLIIFETYCKIHKSINIDMIAKNLNMNSETAEKWIVNLIREAKLDAKIDSERNRVEITREPPNISQQIVDKTRSVAMRSQMLIQNIDKPVSDRDTADFRRRVGGTGYRSGQPGFSRGGGRGRN